MSDKFDILGAKVSDFSGDMISDLRFLRCLISDFFDCEIYGYLIFIESNL